MRVQLEQREIAIALQEYIVNQGINLNGKKVEITFTAGRKDTGLIADLNIEEVGALPPLTGDDEGDDAQSATQARPELKAVAGTAVAGGEEAQAQAQAPAGDEEAEAAEAASTTKSSTSSLFG